MTWRNSIWQGGYRWLLLGLSLMLVGILVAVHTVGDEPRSDRVIATVAIVVAFVTARFRQPLVRMEGRIEETAQERKGR